MVLSFPLNVKGDLHDIYAHTQKTHYDITISMKLGYWTLRFYGKVKVFCSINIILRTRFAVLSWGAVWVLYKVSECVGERKPLECLSKKKLMNSTFVGVTSKVELFRFEIWIWRSKPQQ